MKEIFKKAEFVFRLIMFAKYNIFAKAISFMINAHMLIVGGLFLIIGLNPFFGKPFLFAGIMILAIPFFIFICFYMMWSDPVRVTWQDIPQHQSLLEDRLYPVAVFYEPSCYQVFLRHRGISYCVILPAGSEKGLSDSQKKFLCGNSNRYVVLSELRLVGKHPLNVKIEDRHVKSGLVSIISLASHTIVEEEHTWAS